MGLDACGPHSVIAWPGVQCRGFGATTFATDNPTTDTIAIAARTRNRCRISAARNRTDWAALSRSSRRAIRRWRIAVAWVAAEEHAFTFGMQRVTRPCDKQQCADE